MNVTGGKQVYVMTMLAGFSEKQFNAILGSASRQKQTGHRPVSVCCKLFIDMFKDEHTDTQCAVMETRPITA